ncbi:SCO3242 family prenyltransferase [Streptomyces sp. NPDC002851]
MPGDALAGAAATGRRPGRRTLLAIGCSLCLYEAGMALNDWADRAEDAVERPHRPLPSGRIAPGAALAAAAALTTTGLALAARAGRPALTVAGALAGTVWAYDLRLKHTPAGPAAMAAARGLDLLLGAAATSGRITPALPSSATLAAHTYAITTVSRQETQGGSSVPPLLALATTLALTASTASTATRRLAAPQLPTAQGGAALLGRHPLGQPGMRRPSAHAVLAGPPLSMARRGVALLRLPGMRRPSAHAVLAGPQLSVVRRGVVLLCLPGMRRPSAHAVLAGPQLSAARRGVALLRLPGMRRPSAHAVLAGPQLSAARRGVTLLRLPGTRPSAHAVLAVTYAVTAARPLLHAALNPSPPLTQRAVGGGIRAMIPLQSALAARSGALGTALATAALAPIARTLARRVSPT